MLTVVLSLLTSLLLGLTLLWCWYQWSHRDLLRQAEKLPSALPRLPFIGSLHHAIGNLETVSDCLVKISRQTSEMGCSSYCFWLGPYPRMVTQDPEHTKRLLNSSNSMRKGVEMEIGLGPFLEEGLLIAPVDRWKVTRRNLNPVFHPRNLEHMVSAINNNSRELVQNLSEHVDTGIPVDVFHPLMEVGLQTVSQVVFGSDMPINTKSKEFHGLLEFVKWIIEIIAVRIFHLWLRSNLIFKFLYRKQLQKTELSFHNFSNNALKRAKENYEVKKTMAETLEDTERNGKGHNGVKERLTVVDVYYRLIETVPFITERSLQHELVSFYTTGTDTIANTIGYCLLAIAQYQDIQERMYDEIVSVMGPEDDVSNVDLKNFPYLEQVFKETLRFFTIVPVVSRRITEEYKLGPCTAPPGTTIWICLAGLHMDPKVYPNPLKFDPERFSAENSKNTDNYTYIPFSGGPRNCIGKAYSYMFMKIMLVHILRRYKLTSYMDITKLKRKYATLMMSSEGYKVFLENRT